MKLRRLVPAALALTTLTATAQEGYWKATSNTARSVTGDIAISGEHLTINFLNFTIAQLRPLKQPEILALFNADDSTPGNGSLYRLNIPADRKLLHKNTICGSEDTTYMAAFASGKTLQVAFFSSAAMPTLTPDAIANNPNLCGTYTYSR